MDEWMNGWWDGMNLPVPGVSKWGKNSFSALGSAITNLDINFGNSLVATTVDEIWRSLLAKVLKLVNSWFKYPVLNKFDCCNNTV